MCPVLVPIRGRASSSTQSGASHQGLGFRLRFGDEFVVVGRRVSDRDHGRTGSGRIGNHTKSLKNQSGPVSQPHSDSPLEHQDIPALDQPRRARRNKGVTVDRVTCFSAEPTFSWPETEPPAAHELQGVLEGLYYSDMYADTGSRGASSRRTPSKPQPNKRGSLLSRRAGTAGTGGVCSCVLACVLALLPLAHS